MRHEKETLKGIHLKKETLKGDNKRKTLKRYIEKRPQKETLKRKTSKGDI